MIENRLCDSDYKYGMFMAIVDFNKQLALGWSLISHFSMTASSGIDTALLNNIIEAVCLFLNSEINKYFYND